MENKKITMDDVAKLAGVSRTSVSSILNGGTPTRMSETTRAKILQAAKQLNYQRNVAASILAGGTSRLIGVMIDSGTSYRGMQQLMEIERICKKRGYRIITSWTHDNIAGMWENCRMMHKYGVDGIICCAHAYPNLKKEVIETFSKEENIVYLEQPFFDTDFVVKTSRQQAFLEFIRDILQRGFQRPGLLCASRKWPSEAAVIQEFTHALNVHKINPDPAQIYECPYLEAPYRHFNRIMEQFKQAKTDYLYIDDTFNAMSMLTRIHAQNMNIPIQGGNNDPLFQNVFPKINSFNPQYDMIAEKLLNVLLKVEKGPVTIEAIYEKAENTTENQGGNK